MMSMMYWAARLKRKRFINCHPAWFERVESNVEYKADFFTLGIDLEYTVGNIIKIVANILSDKEK